MSQGARIARAALITFAILTLTPRLWGYLKRKVM